MVPGCLCFALVGIMEAVYGGFVFFAYGAYLGASFFDLLKTSTSVAIVAGAPVLLFCSSGKGRSGSLFQLYHM